MSGIGAAAAASGSDVQVIDLYAPFSSVESIEAAVESGQLNTAALSDLILRSEQILSLLREETDLLERNAAQTTPIPDAANIPTNIPTLPGAPAPGLGLLSIDERSDLVNAEFELYRQRRETAMRSGERELLHHRAQLEDADLAATEARVQLIDLQRELGLNVGTDEMPSSPVAPQTALVVRKFFEDHAKQQETHTERLRAKAKTLRATLSKQDQHHRSRGELGDALQAIDFDQLKIENQQFLERIEEKNAELVKLKVSTGLTVHEMNLTNESLVHVTADQQWLKKEIAAREAHLGRIQSESSTVESERSQASRTHRALVQQHSSVRVPKVSAYLAVKVEQDALERATANWHRKVDIAEGQRKVLRSQLREAATMGLISQDALSAIGPAPKLDLPPRPPKGFILGVPEEGGGGLMWRRRVAASVCSSCVSCRYRALCASCDSAVPSTAYPHPIFAVSQAVPPSHTRSSCSRLSRAGIASRKCARRSHTAVRTAPQS